MAAPFEVEAASAERYADFLAFYGELRLDDRAPSRERWLAEMAPQTFFLVARGTAVAYGWGQALADSGYVRHVVVAPSARGTGLGREAMREHARRFRAAGLGRWELNVLRQNSAAVALYRSLGMEVEFATSVVRVAPADVARLPSTDRPVRARDLPPNEHAPFEGRFELPAGFLAQFPRAHGHRVVAIEEPAADRSVPAGVAHFDPAYPGCFPFRVAAPQLARALLEAVLPDVPPGSPWIQLVIERDAELARVLRHLGAEVVQEIVHMSGPIPAA